MTQEERTTGQLADVQDLSWKEKPVPKDRGKHIRVFSRAYGSEENDVGALVHSICKSPSGSLEEIRCGVCALGTEREALQILRRDVRIRRKETVRHRDDLHAVDLPRRTREGTRILELASEVQPAQEAEHLAQRCSVLAHAPREGASRVRLAKQERARAVCRCRGQDEDPLTSDPRGHGGAVRNFGARDTFLAVQTRLPLALLALLPLAPSCVQPPPWDTPATTVNTAELAIASDSAARALLIDVRLIDPTIMVDARYATADNFTGAPLPGYESNRALLRREAAAALGRVQRRARFDGYALKIFDAYRPVRATLAMVDWTERTGRQDLLRDGYIASRSRHNLGLAVDLTLIDGSGADVAMGTPFDTFSEAAHTANATGEVAVNRALLVRLMQAEGFTNYEKEWWHFSYSAPNPLRFDLVIR